MIKTGTDAALPRVERPLDHVDTAQPRTSCGELADVRHSLDLALPGPNGIAA